VYLHSVTSEEIGWEHLQKGLYVEYQRWAWVGFEHGLDWVVSDFVPKLTSETSVHMVKRRHSNLVTLRSLCCWTTRRILCEVNGESLSRYSNKIKSVG